MVTPENFTGRITLPKESADTLALKMRIMDLRQLIAAESSLRLHLVENAFFEELYKQYPELKTP